MSYLNIPDFIEAGNKSLKDKNYWSALSIALMLPSICSRICFANCDKYKNYKWNDKNDHNKGKTYTGWKDKECYIDFCNLIMRGDIEQNGETISNAPDEYLISILGDKYSELLYSLRCDILHSGTVNIYDDDKGIYLMLGESLSARDLSKYRIIPIKDLCERIFDYIKIWYDNYNFWGIPLKDTCVFDIENNADDKLLFEKLCSDDRAEYLKQKFEKENSERK